MSYLLYFLGIIAAIVSMLLSISVKTKFNKWSKREFESGLTGADVAEKMLMDAGIYDVEVVQTSGNLSDHYDPRNKTVNLSESVFCKSNVAAAAVAAHECGHAIQHNKSYFPLKIRNAIVPVANIGSSSGVYIFMLGMILSRFADFTWMLDLGIIFFTFSVMFYFITLPVEFNASRRALSVLKKSIFLDRDEIRGAKIVLRAAAMTYVAAAASAAIQLFRLVFIRGRD